MVGGLEVAVVIPRSGDPSATADRGAVQERAPRRVGRPAAEASSWWWVALCGALTVVAALAAATGRVDHAAAAVVAGAAVASAPARPRGVEALADVGVLGGIGIAAISGRPAALAGVAVAAAAAQLALSHRGRPRAVASGLLVTAVAGALALRAAGPTTVGGAVEGEAGGVLVLAALLAALLALPRREATRPTGAVVTAALAVSALGVVEGGTTAAAAASLAAIALAIDRRPSAALVAAAVAASATAAEMAGPLALAAAAVTAALVAAHEPQAGDGTDDEPGDDRPPAWGATSEGPADRPPGGGAPPRDPAPRAAGPSATRWIAALAALPAGAAALDVAAARTPSAILVVAALVGAAGLPALLDREDAGAGEDAPRLPPAAWPAAAVAAATLMVPGRIGWVGDPLPHWPVGAGFAAMAMAVAIAFSPRSRPERRGAVAPPPARPAWSVPSDQTAGPEPEEPEEEQQEEQQEEPREPLGLPRGADVPAPRPQPEPAPVRRSAMTAAHEDTQPPRRRGRRGR